MYINRWAGINLFYYSKAFGGTINQGTKILRCSVMAAFDEIREPSILFPGLIGIKDNLYKISADLNELEINTEITFQYDSDLKTNRSIEYKMYTDENVLSKANSI